MPELHGFMHSPLQGLMFLLACLFDNPFSLVMTHTGHSWAPWPDSIPVTSLCGSFLPWRWRHYVSIKC